jgi:tetratricopeptide (TPR) repeat protein
VSRLVDSRGVRPWLVLLWLLAAGCAVSQPRFPVGAFVAGDYAVVRDFALREVEDGDTENLALVWNVQAQCELLLGQPDLARGTFERAAQAMGNWQVSGGETAGAILGSESSKTWKGDPFEKSMNAFYLAFCYLLKGEPDNARAACKKGILADAEVADEKYQADNALLFWMAGRMSKLLGSDEAFGYFAEAQKANEFALQHGARGDVGIRALEQPTAGNLVLLCECGLGPEKFADGDQEELARFRPRSHPAVRARATVDGRRGGNAAILLDVDYQASTLGGTAMQGIREGKAVFKSVSAVAGIVLLDQALRSHERHKDAARTQAIVGGALLLASLLTSTSADVRYWPTLPSTVQVLTLDVAPGPHEVVVEFLDASGRVLPTLSQRVTAEVPVGGESWYLFRSLPAPKAPVASASATAEAP